ncbi:protease Do-like 5, chloroplastic isoform X1 [Quercus lobata]|uniref:protease Do-like 5, chloroplastic isoform X1 n=1 Tax=Quercus lobata TaxID=97700 RepID=UPI00124408B1|nr:protease Do-like 5, chloroplastic isoform X1 [Quercus lobata]
MFDCVCVLHWHGAVDAFSSNPIDVDFPVKHEVHEESSGPEASPSVVFIKELEIVRSPKTTSDDVNLIEDENAKVDGTGSGFIWDNFGHIVTNHHVVAKLATDGSGIHCCKIYLADTRGNGFYREGKIVGVDPEYDLAVLKLTKEDVQACVR